MVACGTNRFWFDVRFWDIAAHSVPDGELFAPKAILPDLAVIDHLEAARPDEDGIGEDQLRFVRHDTF